MGELFEQFWRTDILERELERGEQRSEWASQFGKLQCVPYITQNDGVLFIAPSLHFL